MKSYLFHSAVAAVLCHHPPTLEICASNKTPLRMLSIPFADATAASGHSATVVRALQSTPQQRFTAMSTALNKTGRPITYIITGWGADAPWTYGNSVRWISRPRDRYSLHGLTSDLCLYVGELAYDLFWLGPPITKAIGSTLSADF